MPEWKIFLLGVGAGASVAFCIGFAFGIACSYIAALKKRGIDPK